MASQKSLNLTNASSRSVESFFFSVSNEKVDGGEAVQKKWQEEDLDGEVENVDGVAELRKRTGSKTSSYENNSNVMWCMIQQWIKLLFLLHTFWLFVTVCSIAEYLLYCVLKKGALLMSASNKINYHFHFLKLLLNFRTVSSLLYVRKILVHWPFLEKSGPQKWVVGATLTLKQNFSAGTLDYTCACITESKQIIDHDQGCSMTYIRAYLSVRILWSLTALSYVQTMHTLDNSFYKITIKDSMRALIGGEEWERVSQFFFA